MPATQEDFATCHLEKHCYKDILTSEWGGGDMMLDKSSEESALFVQGQKLSPAAANCRNLILLH